MTEIYNLSSVCRCCHADGQFKRLDMSYMYKNNTEVYSIMLQETLRITMNQPSSDVSYSICDECITELRAATRFRRQVLDCEQKFYEYCQNEQATTVNVESIKIESDFETDLKCIKSEVEVEFGNDYSDAIDNDVSENVKEEKDSTENNQNVIITNTELGNDKKSSSKQKTRPKKPATPRKKVSLEVVNKTKNGVTYSCKECGGTYTKKSDLKKHISGHHKPTYKCQQCSEEFSKRSLYYLHRKMHGNMIPQCQYCGRTFKSTETMKQHENSKHTKERVYICDICQKQFFFKVSIVRHLRWHLGLQKKFICDTCGVQANDMSNLKIHVMTVHEKIKRFSCTLCDKKFSTNKLLKYHTLMHNGIKPFVCKLCSEGFNHDSGLKRHLESHYTSADGKTCTKKYKCVVCGAKFDIRANYNRHLRTHRGSLPFKCPDCCKDFSTRYCFNRHIAVMHTPGVDKKPFECDICQLKFSTKSVLIRHKERIHDPNRPLKVKVKCNLCKQSVYDMEGHMKTHTVRPFSCDYCSKTYPARNALNRHLKDHFKTEKFPCDKCSKVYKRITGLKRHQLKAHKVVPKQEDLEYLGWSA